MPQFIHSDDSDSTTPSENQDSQSFTDQSGPHSRSQTSNPIAPHHREIIEYTPRRSENKREEKGDDLAKKSDVSTPPRRVDSQKNRAPQPRRKTNYQCYNRNRSNRHNKSRDRRSLLDRIKALFYFIFRIKDPKRKKEDRRRKRGRYRGQYRNRRSGGGRSRRQGGDGQGSTNRQNNRGGNQQRGNDRNQRNNRGGRPRNARPQSSDTESNNSNSDGGGNQPRYRSRNRRRDRNRTDNPRSDRNRENDSR